MYIPLKFRFRLWKYKSQLGEITNFVRWHKKEHYSHLKHPAVWNEDTRMIHHCLHYTLKALQRARLLLDDYVLGLSHNNLLICFPAQTSPENLYSFLSLSLEEVDPSQVQVMQRVAGLRLQRFAA